MQIMSRACLGYVYPVRYAFEPEVLQITERAGEGMAVAALRGPRRGVTHRAAEEGVGGRDAQGQRILTAYSSLLVVMLQIEEGICTS